MQNKNDMNLLMISAGFEHGGNVCLRHLDNHPNLYVYPFESQLGNRHTIDYLTSLERFQYRYPEFPANLSTRELYELFYDEELKTLLRKPNGSKFKSADIKMNEEQRIAIFCELLEGKTLSRANIVAAFFKATFSAWENYKLSGKNNIYVGYSPIIGIDAPKILQDFPNAHIVHVVRNPLSAYSDTKLRPFPLPMRQYVVSWGLYHHIVSMHQQSNPDRISIIRYEDLVSDPKQTLSPVCSKLGIDFNDSMLYPSFNGVDLSDNIYPWGTIKSATPEANIAAAKKLTKQETDFIVSTSKAMLKHFNYEDLVSEITGQKQTVAV